MIDYNIKNWKAVTLKNKEEYLIKLKNKFSVKIISFKCIDVYALFKCTCVESPNGILTMFKNGFPLDNHIWWDFYIEDNTNFIHVIRTHKQLEVRYFNNNIDFNINLFFTNNLRMYTDDINSIKKSFEKHIIYINHYKSYLDTVSILLDDILLVDLKRPNTIQGHLATQEEINIYTDSVLKYTENLKLFHPKAKLLLLNLAFMIESFINLIIRIGIKKELMNYDQVVKKYLNSNFKDKLECIKLYTCFFKEDIDINNIIVKNILELMTIRNKYVHFDEYSKINILGEEYFDKDFPLFNINNTSFEIDLLEKTYLNPSKNELEKYYNAGGKFKNYIFSLIDPLYVDEIEQLLLINPISFNTQKKLYSSIYPELLYEFYFPLKDKT